MITETTTTDASGHQVKTTTVDNNCSVSFNPTFGIQGKADSKVLTPADALWHEIGHFLDAIESPAEFARRSNNVYPANSPDVHYTDEEEKYNEEKHEHPLSREEGHLIRNSHDISDVDIITTTSPTSTTIDYDKMPLAPLQPAGSH